GEKPSVQWAAVTTQVSLRIEPPQICANPPPNCTCSEICQLFWPGMALRPPTISPDRSATWKPVSVQPDSAAAASVRTIARCLLACRMTLLAPSLSLQDVTVGCWQSLYAEQ